MDGGAEASLLSRLWRGPFDRRSENRFAVWFRSGDQPGACGHPQAGKPERSVCCQKWMAKTAKTAKSAWETERCCQPGLFKDYIILEYWHRQAAGGSDMFRSTVFQWVRSWDVGLWCRSDVLDVKGLWVSIRRSNSNLLDPVSIQFSTQWNE